MLKKFLLSAFSQTFFSGIIMGLSPEPLNAWFLAWFALAPLWILIFNSIQSFRKIVLLALAWGFGYYGTSLFWITGLHPMTWMGIPWINSLLIAISCWFIVTFWGSALVCIWGLLFWFICDRILFNKQEILKQSQKNEVNRTSTFKKLSRDLYSQNFFASYLLKILIGVTLWCCLESLWSLTPLWWSSLSLTQSPGNLIILQLGKISGFNTITASIVAINGLIAEFILLKNKIKVKGRYKIIAISFPCFLIIFLHLVGFLFYQQPIANNNLKPLQIGIIQGNIPNEIKLYPGGLTKALKGYTSGYNKLAKQGADLIITPETALPFYWDKIIKDSSFYQAVLKEKVPALVGAFGRNEAGFTNSLFAVTGTGKTLSRYDKYKLVPLGEYIPFRPILGKLIKRLSPLEAHLIPGKKEQEFNTPFGKAIAAICYESAFSQHFRRGALNGGTFIITSSNNAHYSDSMPAQHHALDVMRAIESDRWMARATNTGYSAIVDPLGHTLWKSILNKYEIYSGKIYQRQTRTLYIQYGDWLTLLLLILSLLLSCFYLLKRV